MFVEVKRLGGAVVLVKWSACLPYTPTIRVRIPLKPSVFSLKVVFEKTENKQKNRPGLAFLQMAIRAVVLAQLTECSLPTPEVIKSKLKNHLFTVNCTEKMKIKICQE